MSEVKKAKLNKKMIKNDFKRKKKKYENFLNETEINKTKDLSNK